MVNAESHISRAGLGLAVQLRLFCLMSSTATTLCIPSPEFNLPNQNFATFARLNHSFDFGFLSSWLFPIHLKNTLTFYVFLYIYLCAHTPWYVCVEVIWHLPGVTFPLRSCCSGNWTWVTTLGSRHRYLPSSPTSLPPISPLLPGKAGASGRTYESEHAVTQNFDFCLF